MSAHGGPANGHGHERSDASTRPLFRFAAGLAVFVAAAMTLMAILFSYFSDVETGRATLASPPAEQGAPAAAAPALQPNPQIDLEQMRREESAYLTSYGWVDQREGLVHIPIDRAIELIAERGLPARNAAPQNQ
jgi:hypothetical protein